jgi:hypothetical protein
MQDSWLFLKSNINLAEEFLNLENISQQRKLYFVSQMKSHEEWRFLGCYILWLL